MDPNPSEAKPKAHDVSYLIKAAEGQILREISKREGIQPRKLQRGFVLVILIQV